MKIPGGRLKRRNWIEHDMLDQACYPAFKQAFQTAPAFAGEKEMEDRGLRHVASAIVVTHQSTCPSFGGGPCRCEAKAKVVGKMFGKPACDFCAVASTGDDPDWSIYPNTEWQHTIYDLRGNAVHASVFEAGEWGACPPCAALIDADEYEKLTDRCMNAPESRSLHAGLSQQVLAHVRASQARLHQEFRAHRGPKVTTPGEPTQHRASGSSPGAQA